MANPSSTLVAGLGRLKPKDTRPIWMEKPKPAVQVAKTIALVIICFLALYPLLAVLATSLSSQSEIANNNGLVLFPKEPTFAAYQTIFAGGVVTDALIR